MHNQSKSNPKLNHFGFTQQNPLQTLQSILTKHRPMPSLKRLRLSPLRRQSSPSPTMPLPYPNKSLNKPLSMILSKYLRKSN